MAIDIRPPAQPGNDPISKRHPRLVHDEMEAIFGSPSNVRSVRQNFAAAMSAQALPELELTRPMGPSPKWIGVAVGIAICLIAASFLVRTLLDSQAQRPAQTTLAPQIPDLPLPAPTAKSAALPATGGATQARPSVPAMPTAPTRLAPAHEIALAPPPRAPIVAPRPEAMKIAPPTPLAPSIASASGKLPVETKPVEAKKSDPCEGTSYEHTASCPSADVRKADRALGAAYASAISANVDPARLSEYSQKWSRLREVAAASPDSTVDEFANMTSQLNALTVAAASAKK